MTDTDLDPDVPDEIDGRMDEAYRELRAPLLRLAFLLCGDRNDAEDAVQTVFTSAHPRWADIDDAGSYLRRSVVNQVKDRQRRDYRRRLLLRPEPEAVTQVPELDETWALVRALPRVQRTVVVLHYYEDLPLVDIAQLLERPPSTVRSDLRRAHARLRKALS